MYQCSSKRCDTVTCNTCCNTANCNTYLRNKMMKDDDDSQLCTFDVSYVLKISPVSITKNPQTFGFSLI